MARLLPRRVASPTTSHFATGSSRPHRRRLAPQQPALDFQPHQTVPQRCAWLPPSTTVQAFYEQAMRLSHNPPAVGVLAQHLCWESATASVRVLEVVLAGLDRADFDEVEPYFMVAEALLVLPDSLRQHRVRCFLGSPGGPSELGLLNSMYHFRYKVPLFTLHCLRHLIELMRQLPEVAAYIQVQQPQYKGEVRYSDWLYRFLRRCFENAGDGDGGGEAEEPSGQSIQLAFTLHNELQAVEGRCYERDVEQMLWEQQQEQDKHLRGSDAGQPQHEELPARLALQRRQAMAASPSTEDDDYEPEGHGGF